MSEPDYYKILGVERSASKAEIKSAYRKLAMKHHPDRHSNANEQERKANETKFKEISHAYDVLSDDQKRQFYDQTGQSNPGGFGGGGAGFEGFGDLGDIFEDLFGGGFGGGGHSSQPQRGRDLLYQLEISLEESIHGTEKKISYNCVVTCDDCDGKGGSGVKTCDYCNGTGKITHRQGFMAIQQTCPKCKGRGQTFEKVCKSCHGEGRRNKKQTVAVKIPAGIDHQSQMRLSGKGEAGPNGAPSGDLIVEIALKAHEIFERNGADLYCQLPIDIVVASLGGELDIPTLSGKVKLKIPAGTQSGQRFRLAGKGVKPLRGHRSGDLLCTVNVETPVHLTSKQKELLKEFGLEVCKNKKHSPNASKWFESVKRIFKQN